jgi:hypothetical protein
MLPEGRRLWERMAVKILDLFNQNFYTINNFAMKQIVISTCPNTNNV